MGMYVASSARARLNEAQAELERHLVTGLDGRCKACGDLEPCRERECLSAVFAGYDELPRRRPGATGVAARTAEAPSGQSWFVR